MPTCPECRRYFKSAQGVTLHRRRTHPDLLEEAPEPERSPLVTDLDVDPADTRTSSELEDASTPNHLRSRPQA